MSEPKSVKRFFSFVVIYKIMKIQDFYSRNLRICNCSLFLETKITFIFEFSVWFKDFGDLESISQTPLSAIYCISLLIHFQQSL